MSTARTLGGAFLAVVGLATVYSSLAEIDAQPAAQRWYGNSLRPVAALAWAQARCDAGLTLSSGTPRLQAEDVLEAAAEFDLLALQHGRSAICREAMALAATVSAEANPSETSHQGSIASIR